MEVTFQSILCKLAVPVVDCSGGGNAPVRTVCPFDVAGVPNGETLYLAPLEAALAADPEGPALSFLCPTPPGGPTALPPCRHRIAVAADCADIRALAARAFDTFHSLWRWQMALQQSILDNEGAQGLIDRSEEILDNTVFLLDTGHRLLAYSRGRPPRPDDAAHRYLVENGHFSDETVRELVAGNFFRGEDGADDGEEVVTKTLSFSDAAVMKRSFRHDGHVYFGAGLLCCYAPRSRGLEDLFRCFCGFLDFYARKGFPYDRKYTAFDALLQAVLEERDDPAGRERLSVCAARCEVPATGLFDLYRIELREDAAQSPIHVLLNLTAAMPDARVTAQRSSIVVLDLLSPEEDPDARFAENRARILALAGDSVAAVGAGNPFRDLHDLRRAYVQAGAALEVIRAYRITDGAAAAMLRFENCYLGHLVYTAVRQDAWLYENCAAPALVRRIRSYDRKNGSSYAAVLQAFLLNERRPTETGQALGLHRNTVIYHISRMTELFGLNLDSPEMRVKLLLALNRSSLEEDGGRLKRK